MLRTPGQFFDVSTYPPGITEMLPPGYMRPEMARAWHRHLVASYGPEESRPAKPFRFTGEAIRESLPPMAPLPPRVNTASVASVPSPGGQAPLNLTPTSSPSALLSPIPSRTQAPGKNQEKVDATKPQVSTSSSSKKRPSNEMQRPPAKKARTSGSDPNVTATSIHPDSTLPDVANGDASFPAPPSVQMGKRTASGKLMPRAKLRSKDSEAPVSGGGEDGPRLVGYTLATGNACNREVDLEAPRFDPTMVSNLD